VAFLEFWINYFGEHITMAEMGYFAEITAHHFSWPKESVQSLYDVINYAVVKDPYIVDVYDSKMITFDMMIFFISRWGPWKDGFGLKQAIKNLINPRTFEIEPWWLGFAEREETISALESCSRSRCGIEIGEQAGFGAIRYNVTDEAEEIGGCGLKKPFKLSHTHGTRVRHLYIYQTKEEGKSKRIRYTVNEKGSPSYEYLRELLHTCPYILHPVHSKFYEIYSYFRKFEMKDVYAPSTNYRYLADSRGGFLVPNLTPETISSKLPARYHYLRHRNIHVTFPQQPRRLLVTSIPLTGE